jgi:hypothetical protein
MPMPVSTISNLADSAALDAPVRGAAVDNAAWRPRLAEGHDAPAANPAHLLQRRLTTELSREPERWSARRSLAFVVLTCGGAWGAIFLIVRALI